MGGDLQLILREGDTHSITGKTVKSLSFLPSISRVNGQTRSFNQSTGDLIYRAAFSDGTSGIYKVVFP